MARAPRYRVVTVWAPGPLYARRGDRVVLHWNIVDGTAKDRIVARGYLTRNEAEAAARWLNAAAGGHLRRLPRRRTGLTLREIGGLFRLRVR